MVRKGNKSPIAKCFVKISVKDDVRSVVGYFIHPGNRGKMSPLFAPGPSGSRLGPTSSTTCRLDWGRVVRTEVSPGRESIFPSGGFREGTRPFTGTLCWRWSSLCRWSRPLWFPVPTTSVCHVRGKLGKVPLSVVTVSGPLWCRRTDRSPEPLET